MFKPAQTASMAERNRLDGLMLLIEPDAADRAEIATLKRKCKQQPLVASDAISGADDDDNTDPEYAAARWQMIASEQLRKERQRDERRAANAQRAYDQRRKEMNSFGLRS